MELEQFIEMLDEKIFELMDQLREEHGASNLVIKQESDYSTGKIRIDIFDKDQS
ncbi:hypothetical protein [Paenibacillus ihbetae]|uniref:hypothetical protein n=1 Tax=Paenibacillus ihbetae TaxID=1870820 RepID=UPI0012FFEBEB|nr:hypothetical protein [Paenibacillus ihbetae]